MDTISRDNNSSYLPVAGVIAGLLALVLSAVALVKVSTANKTLDEQGAKVAKIDGIESQLTTTTDTANKAKVDLSALTRSTQDAFNQVGPELANLHEAIKKIEEARKPAAKKNGEPVVAGPGEYIVKMGDTSGTKIAKANGVSIADLQAVNPGVDWNHLKIGQKLKLPKK